MVRLSRMPAKSVEILKCQFVEGKYIIIIKIYNNC